MSAETGRYMTRDDAAGAERVVVKAGTNSLTDDDSNLDRLKLDKLVNDVMDLVERGRDVILVSSGAIGAGKGRVPLSNSSVEDLQAASTVGQSDLMRNYSESFERYGKDVAQILVTHHDLEDSRRFSNFRNTVETLFDWGVVPVVNENDAVAVEEIQVGDNDIISSSIAVGVDADLLVTLTDVEGVYTDNPRRNADAELIDEVRGDETEDVWENVTDDGADFGGITTKIEGAERVNDAGIPAIIAGSEVQNVLGRVADAERVGTFFAPEVDER
ncbi:glutamate 5-kinase [Haladaptatus sp. F3-133]|uniref:Glutamate 5-kinase n=1 Tax=Halorutilus salinus TaxID=2487751 RepID=A0A9Q4GGY7_9EURY|nr:glutamate 5-kinase [Halorutilus salinus]MCX2818240.1 glutamate 5-kinase [Halorutilus salinus]